MPQYEFGTGDLWSIVEGTNRTPRMFGTLQEVSIDISVNMKELHGQKKFAVALAQGLGKITCKAKAAHIYGRQWAELMFGDATVTAGTRKIAPAEAGVVPGTPYQVTVTNSAVFFEDLGVRNAANGNALTKVASAPATGQYSVAAGVYTFAAADTGISVLISYSYTPAGTTGVRYKLVNQDLGTQTFFSVVLRQNFDGDDMYVKLFRCVGSKLMLATKLEDFNIPEFDFSAFANVAGDVIEFGHADE